MLFRSGPAGGNAVETLNRRGAGAVDRGGLENRCTLMRTERSNPSLSVPEYLVDQALTVSKLNFSLADIPREMLKFLDTTSQQD
jgi:hypothetical protein